MNDKKITSEDARLIKAFVSEVIATRRVCLKRAYKLTYGLIGLRRFVDPFSENTVEDIYRGLELLQAAGFKKNTVLDYERFLKRFYLWLIENEHSRVDEKKIRKIRIGKGGSMTKTAASLLTEEEVKRMLDACQNSRDRCLIMMLYEGAFRIGELGNLTWGKVRFSEYNVTVNVDDKTGKPRLIPLYKTVPYMAAWRADYPGEITPEKYVFITRRGLQLNYQGVSKQLKKIAARAGVEKRITPHLFRHSSITQMIRDGLSEPVIKKIAWGTTETDMFKTYAHLVDADVEKAVAMRNGIIKPEEIIKEKVLEPRQCPRCYYINRPDQEYCGKCGMPLTGEARQKTLKNEELIAMLATKPEVLDALKTIISEVEKPKT